jgi:hypothetical protein
MAKLCLALKTIGAEASFGPWDGCQASCDLLYIENFRYVTNYFTECGPLAYGGRGGLSCRTIIIKVTFVPALASGSRKAITA